MLNQNENVLHENTKPPARVGRKAHGSSRDCRAKIPTNIGNWWFGVPASVKKGINMGTKFGILSWASLLVIACSGSPSDVSAGTSVVSSEISSMPLIHANNLVYKGAFRMPAGASGFAYSQGTIAYNSVNNSLFIVGASNAPTSISNNYVANISIPSLASSTDVLSLPTSTLIQPLSDITEGNQFNIGANGAIHGTTNGVNIGGLLVYNISGVNKLVGSVYSYYDGSHTATRSHFVSGTSLATTGDFQGMYKVGVTPNPVPQAGFIAGYMAKVPTSWQSALGGPVLTGKAGIPIVSRTSYGPSAFVFDPAKLTGKPDDSSAIPATPLVYYDTTHQTLGSWDISVPSNEFVSIGDNITGVVFPEGTKSILFFGRHGSENCYGPGTTILSQKDNGPGMACEGGSVTVGNRCCFDIITKIYDKGTHSYPFKAYVWAYNAEDFAAVKAGSKQPWDIKPYAVWDLAIPTITYNSSEIEIHIGGAAYDSTTKRIYVTQNHVEGNSPKPIIHVYELQGIPPKTPDKFNKQ